MHDMKNLSYLDTTIIILNTYVTAMLITMKTVLKRYYLMCNDSVLVVYIL